jgi:hypothetical protein
MPCVDCAIVSPSSRALLCRHNTCRAIGPAIVHAILGKALGFGTVVVHTESDFLLHVWSADGLSPADVEPLD